MFTNVHIWPNLWLGGWAAGLEALGAGADDAFGF